MIFENRIEAGKLLSKKLTKYKNKKNTIVIGLPRGGVITANQISKELNLPLDIIVTRKIGALHNPELAIGAVTQDGQIIIDEKIVEMIKSKETFNVADKKHINQIAKKEKIEAERRLKLYRGKREPLNLINQTIILTDDGIATGNTIKAAIKYAKKIGVKKIILAIPIAPKEKIRSFKKEVDEIICLEQPLEFYGIGQFYKNFEQITDEQVINLMKEKNEN